MRLVSRLLGLLPFRLLLSSVNCGILEKMHLPGLIQFLSKFEGSPSPSLNSAFISKESCSAQLLKYPSLSVSKDKLLCPRRLLKCAFGFVKLLQRSRRGGLWERSNYSSTRTVGFRKMVKWYAYSVLRRNIGFVLKDYLHAVSTFQGLMLKIVRDANRSVDPGLTLLRFEVQSVSGMEFSAAFSVKGKTANGRLLQT